MRDPLRLIGVSQHYRIEGLKEAPNWPSMMPRDASLSSEGCVPLLINCREKFHQGGFCSPPPPSCPPPPERLSGAFLSPHQSVRCVLPCNSICLTSQLKTVPVLPSLIFPFHLLPSPVHLTGFSFCFFAVFFASD